MLMTPTEHIAGWLDVAAAPIWYGAEAKVRIHPVCLHQCTCHAISLNGRWVCSTDGSLTIFQSLESAEHFLDLANVENYEFGEPAELSADCSIRTQCVSFPQDGTLTPCRVHCVGTH